jgi:hypothetical protein
MQTPCKDVSWRNQGDTASTRFFFAFSGNFERYGDVAPVDERRLVVNRLHIDWHMSADRDNPPSRKSAEEALATSPRFQARMARVFWITTTEGFAIVVVAGLFSTATLRLPRTTCWGTNRCIGRLL